MQYSYIPRPFFVLFLCLIIVVGAGTRSFAVPVQPPVSFLAARAYASARGPFWGLQKGDFDADGNTDFVTTSNNDNFVVFGDSAGGFAPPISVYNFSGGNYFPVVGDFNEDGRSDIVLPYRYFGVRGLAVYLGRADRTFAPPVTSHLGGGPEPTWMQVVDYDLDGNLDIVAGAESNDGNSLVFCKGNGEGSFTFGDRATTTRGSLPIIADFNTDGLPDVLYSELFTGHRIYINPGNGLFGSPTTIDLPIDDRAVGAEDVNADGHPDIITVYGIHPNRWATVWLGSGPFSYSMSHDSQFAGSENVWLGDIVDLDLDGKQDLVFNSKNRILIKKGNGDGTFAEPVEIHEGGNGFYLDDLNGDGAPDIVASQANEFAVAGSGSVVKLLNLGSLRFSSAPALPVTGGVGDIAVGDLNGDGLKDIVVITEGGNVQFFVQSPARDYARVENDQARISGGSVLDMRAVAVADLNSDGLDDVLSVGRGVLSENSYPNCIVLVNQGNGDFAPSLFHAGTDELYDLATSDINEDGKLDLITVGFQGTWVLTGNGDGTFGPPAPIQPNVASRRAVVSDFNNDEKPDLAVLNYHVNKVAVLLNNGNGGFGNPTLISMPLGVHGIATAHMNSDAYADILVSHGSGVSVSLNIGNAVFSEAVRYSITQGPAFELASADYNVDGKADAAVMAGRNSLVVLLNNGTGGLSRETVWGGGVETLSLATSDLNSDSKPDLLLGYSAYSGRVKLYFNVSEPSLVVPRTFFDYDGDGKADLTVRRPTDNIWYLLQSTAGYTGMTWGVAGDLLAPADYDGDSKTDIAVFRPSEGRWYIVMSQTGSFQAINWGQAGDLPIPADRDNDGRADLMLFRESNTTWYARSVTAGPLSSTVFGAAGDKPVRGDFDADGVGDMAVYRSSNNNWYILKSTAGFFVQTWGEAGDVPVPADYDGDGATDLAVFRPGTGQWYLNQSTVGFEVMNWGEAADIPVPADYDGDGKSDPSVFRPANGTWYMRQSLAGFAVRQFGQTGDVPTPSAFIY